MDDSLRQVDPSPFEDSDLDHNERPEQSSTSRASLLSSLAHWDSWCMSVYLPDLPFQ